MVMVIVSALVETLTKHMFNNYLNEMDKIEIGGAPSWYMKPVDDKICSFAHKNGGMDNIEITKKNAKYKMVKKINGIIDIVVYDNFKNIQNKKEKDVVNLWKKDTNLPIFVDKNIDFSRVDYEDEIDTTFVRACISKQVVLEYETARLQKIKKEVIKVKANNAFEDLDNSFSNKKQPLDKNDPFSELP